VLEKTTAETQLGFIEMQMNQLKQDIELNLLEYRILLNTSDVIPETTEKNLEANLSADTNAIRSHPQLKLIEQQKTISTISLKLERSKLLPELTAAYNNMSMRGSGADNVFYDGKTRFQSAQIGLGIPLFFGAQRSKVKAAKTNQLIAANSYANSLQLIKADHAKAFAEYSKNLKAVNYYEQKALKNAETIIQTANKQFSSGEINYLEWVLLTNQGITIQSEYINVRKSLNESIIQLNYLNTK
jgi:cobalt-zinc-cadmium resistance protein CzcA